MYFFFNDTATTEIYTLSLHDALPIWIRQETNPSSVHCPCARRACRQGCNFLLRCRDRKSTRLNSSHLVISYAVFCLKKTSLQGQAPFAPQATSPSPSTTTTPGLPTLS